MSEFISDVLRFQDVLGKNVKSKYDKDPERPFLGINTPLESAIWGAVTGKKYSPTVDMFGGATQDDSDKAKEAGVNPKAGESMHDIARAVTAYYAGGELRDLISKGGLSSEAAPETKGANPTGESGTWRDFVPKNLQMPQQQQKIQQFQPAQQSSIYQYDPNAVKTSSGEVVGPGSATSDSVDIKASNGEYVLNKGAVDLVGKDKLDEINAMGIEKRGYIVNDPNPGHLANGGLVMNWGGFAGGLSQGIERGMRIGEMLKKANQEREVAEAAKSAREEAGSAYDRRNAERGAKIETGPAQEGQSYVDPTSGVQVNPVPAPASVEERSLSDKVSASSPTASPDKASAATAAASQPTVQATPQNSSPQGVVSGGMPQTGKFFVGDKGFDTKEQAQEAAGVRSDPADRTDYINSQIANRVHATLLDQGRLEEADKWLKWGDSSRGKRVMRDWAAAWNAPDFDTAAAKFGKFYTEHIDDGVDYTGHKMRTNADGTQVAVVTLKNKATGKESEVELTREKMLALGGQYNPQHMFELEMQRQTAADKMRYEAQLKAQQRRADNADAIQREGYKQDRIDARQDAALGGKVDALRQAGYTDDEIRSMMPTLVGAGDHKKTTAPAERRALIASDLMKNDPTFARLPKDQQNRRIDDMMGVIYGEQGSPAPAIKFSDKAVPLDPARKPVYLTGPQFKGTPNYNKPFYQMPDGSYAPVQAVPQEGGLPKK